MFVIERKPKSIEAEAYRGLRSNIEYSSFDDKYRIIVVTSSVPGEGKSTTAGNLALTMAQNNKKVLLVDCDMRKPSLHKKFKVSNKVGLSDLLKGKEKIGNVAQRYNENLLLLTSGSLPPNPAEMLGSDVMTRFLSEARNHFDYIILDTAPLQAVTDAQILSTKADGTLLVVRAASTKKNEVTSSVDLLKKVKADIIGTVLNAAENSIGKKYYYYE